MADRLAFIYEGRILFKDVEPGVGGDVIELVDHPERNGDAKFSWAPTLDELLEEQTGLSTLERSDRRFRIVVEEI